MICLREIPCNLCISYNHHPSVKCTCFTLDTLFLTQPAFHTASLFWIYLEEKGFMYPQKVRYKWNIRFPSIPLPSAVFSGNQRWMFAILILGENLELVKPKAASVVCGSCIEEILFGLINYLKVLSALLTIFFFWSFLSKFIFFLKDEIWQFRMCF